MRRTQSEGPLCGPTSSGCAAGYVVALQRAQPGALVTATFGDSIFRLLLKTTNWKFRLKDSWCGESLISASWHLLMPTKGWPKSPEAFTESDWSGQPRLLITRQDTCRNGIIQVIVFVWVVHCTSLDAKLHMTVIMDVFIINSRLAICRM